jgi:hypothetical protein
MPPFLPLLGAELQPKNERRAARKAGKPPGADGVEQRCVGRQIAPSAAAERQRRRRQRQRLGLIWLPVEVDEFALVNTLVAGGLLAAAAADDHAAVQAALERLLAGFLRRRAATWPP